MNDNTKWFKDFFSHEKLIDPAKKVRPILIKILEQRGRSVSNQNTLTFTIDT